MYVLLDEIKNFPTIVNWGEYFLPEGSNLHIVMAENGWIIYENHWLLDYKPDHKCWVFTDISDVVAFGCNYENSKGNNMSTITATQGTAQLPLTGSTGSSLSLTSNGGILSVDTSGSSISVADPFAFVEPYTSRPSLNIERVENGYIINHNYKRYVFPTIEDALKFIGESIAGK